MGGTAGAKRQHRCNVLLVRARRAVGLSQQDLAEAVSRKCWSDAEARARPAIDANYIGKLERGVISRPQRRYREALKDVLGAATDAQLGFALPRQVEDPDSPTPVGLAETVSAPAGRRVVRCDQRGLPAREEVDMAAEESARFRRWSASTNVDDDVLEQMQADVAEIAFRYLVDPPATVFARLVGARDDVFGLIVGRQSPRHTTSLYKIGGQLCALLAHASADLGHPHAADTHARTALHCADIAGYPPLRVYTRWVQSNVAFWEGRYDDAAELVEAGLADAGSGTTLLRLASQQARIDSARQDVSGVLRTLAIAAGAPSEQTAAEPGVFAFATGKAAYYASEAHRRPGGARHLDAAVAWAVTAVDEFVADRRTNAQFVAAARIDLASAHLARGDLDAVAEHLGPVLAGTGVAQRTVPVVSRAASLGTLLSADPARGTACLAALQQDLADFCATPAAIPAELGQGT